jgi:thymidylate synthase
MEKRYVETLSKFNYFESKKRKDEKEAFRKTYDKFQKKMGRNEPINKINKFIEQRLRYDQKRREEYMDNL